MSSIFFAITPQQEKEIKLFMSEEGYTSKAEFFRFLLKFFKYNRCSNMTQLENAIDELENTIKTMDKKGAFKNLPSAKEQLKDV